MPDDRDLNDLHYRAMTEQESVNAYTTEVQKRAPHLTQRQATMIGAAMYEMYKGPVPGIRNDVYFEYLEKQRPELFRRAPSALQAHAWLCGGDESATTRITKWREIERMSSDDLLAMVPHDAQLPADPAPVKAVPTAPTLTETQRANNWTPEDAVLAERGYDVDKLDPHKRVELRREIARETAAPDMVRVAEVKAHLACGKKWSELNWSVQRTAFDEAKRAGKTLAELGVDVTS